MALLVSSIEPLSRQRVEAPIVQYVPARYGGAAHDHEEIVERRCAMRSLFVGDGEFKIRMGECGT